MESSNIQEIISQDPTLNSIYNDKELLKRNASNIEKFLVQRKGCNPNEVKAFLDNMLGDTTIQVDVNGAETHTDDILSETRNVDVSTSDSVISEVTDISEIGGVVGTVQEEIQQGDTSVTNNNVIGGSQLQTNSIQQDNSVIHDGSEGIDNSVNVGNSLSEEKNDLGGYVNNQDNTNTIVSEQAIPNIENDSSNNIQQFQQVSGQEVQQEQISQTNSVNVGQVQQQPNMQQNQMNNAGQAQLPYTQQNQANSMGQIQQPQNIQQNQYNGFGQVQPNVQQVQYNNVGQWQQAGAQQVPQGNVGQWPQAQYNNVQSGFGTQSFQSGNVESNGFQQSFGVTGQNDGGTQLPEVKKENFLTKLLNKIFKKKSL